MEASKKASDKDVCPGTKRGEKNEASPSGLVQLGKPELGKAEFDAAREKLANAEGPEYWRNLQELAGDPEFQAQLQREFPRGASEWLDPVSRRGFLKLMGASLALAGMTACTKQPPEAIVPYVRQPEEIIPGKPLFYASAMPMSWFAQPVLVESHMGRPTKIEGNPEHPASLGGSDIFMQASVLDLYDPDRSQAPLFNGEYRAWANFLSAIRGPLNAQRATQGTSGLRFLTRNIASPTMAAQLRALLARYPGAKWYQWEAVNRDNIRAGAIMAFGQDVDTQYRIADCDVILALDADFLNSGFPGQLRYAREYASRRRPKGAQETPGVATATLMELPSSGKPMNRMYMIESVYTVTGAKADHRLPVRAVDVEHYARLIASRLGVNAGGGTQPRDEFEAKFIDGLVKDLEAHRGTSAVIAGPEQSPVVHALAHAINQALGNLGKTVIHTDPVVAESSDNMADIRALVDEMRAGKVDMLVIVHGNPVYDAPADLNFADALGKVPTAIHYGLYTNETTQHVHWHVPATHYLEQWGDTRTYDGTVSIVQPLIAPLYDTKSDHEFLAAFGEAPDQSGYETIRAYWQQQVRTADFEAWWRKAVHDGYVANSAMPVRTVKASANLPSPTPALQGVEVVLRRDPSVWDGRFANNAWLQELPRPMNQLVWDNPALVSPQYADRMGLKTEDVLEIEVGGRKQRAGVWVQPGHPDNSITLFLGYGRQRAGRVGTGIGFDAYQLRTTAAPAIITSAKVAKTGDKYPLASRQGYFALAGRDNMRAATLEEFQKNPNFAHVQHMEPVEGLTLYPNYEYPVNKWGMHIDQGACVGCNACVIACQSENNIPVVGKHEVQRGREMHWLRIDTYYTGDAANPKAYFQPLPCMHCENAPCEVVCPVAATVHSSEGLNDMVYNRCVGTRYCSNNCPYKVRRFNFLLFQDWNTPQLKMLRNPDVSVRPRGVMEKCTFCVQRIMETRIQAEKENREIRDGEVMTACQQACPADAIVFGDLNNKRARVTRLKSDPRDYGLLTELNTRPRTTYMAVVTNPNPEIPQPHGGSSVHASASVGATKRPEHS